MHAGNKLELGFAEIGRDMRVGERRPERGGMRGFGKRAIVQHAQALFFNTSTQPSQYSGSERGEPLLDQRHGNGLEFLSVVSSVTGDSNAPGEQRLGDGGSRVIQSGSFHPSSFIRHPSEGPTSITPHRKLMRRERHLPSAGTARCWVEQLSQIRKSPTCH